MENIAKSCGCRNAIVLNLFVQEIKQEFSKKAMNNQAILVPASISAPCDDTSVTPSSANENYFAFKKKRFGIL